MSRLLLGWLAPEVPGIAGRIDAELEALSSGALVRWVFFAALIAVAGWVAVWGVGVAERFARSLFADPRQRISRFAAGLRVLVGAATVFAALRPLFTKAPFIMIVVTVLFAIVAGRVAANPLRNLLAGLALVRRRSLVEGDVISVGKVEGTVTAIGLFRTLVVDEHGSRRFVPNRSLVADEVTIAATAGVARVRIQLGPMRPPPAARLEEARRAVLTSPFREPGGFADVELGADGRVHVEMETWASGHAEEIERRLKRRLERVLSAPAEEGGSA